MKKTTLYFPVLCALLLFAGPQHAQTTLNGTIQSGGLTREYLLYIPAAYTGTTPVPLLLNLHGYGSNNIEQLFYSNFKPIADTANFLMVLPNGTVNPQGDRFWNTFLPVAPVDDVAFLNHLIDTLSAAYAIDPNRIYSTGMSNGGFMSYEMACQPGSRIAAIASVTGSMIQSKLDNCQPGRPVPVMEIHGTADAVVPYNGLPLSTFVPIPELLDKWVALNHCQATPVFTQVPDININDGCTAEHYLYTGGDNGSTVEHYKIIGGGHTWPGSPVSVGVTNQDINASREIWRFFSQYTLQQLTPVAGPDSAPAAAWTAWPNPATDLLVVDHPKAVVPDNLRVVDAAGRLVTTLTPDAMPFRINTSAWAPGLYFLLLEADQHPVQQLKVIKHRD